MTLFALAFVISGRRTPVAVAPRYAVNASNRRQLVATAAAAVVVAVPTTLAAVGGEPEKILSNPALVWREAQSLKTCAPSVARRVFGERFVSYLARFLLAYDRGSRLFWRATADEVPLGWDEPRARRKRAEQFAEFAASVEAGLCPYAEKSDGTQLGVRQLVSLLRSRYGQLPDAARQLALSLSLLEPPYQPNDAIAALSAKAQNASVVAVSLDDPGVFVGTKAAVADATLFATLAAPPALASYGGYSSKPATFGSPVVLRPTGRVVGFRVEDGGCGYDPNRPPEVRVAPPVVGAEQTERAAVGRAVVDAAQGRISRIVVEDSGAGYDDADPASVEIEPAPDASRCGAVPSATALLEWEIAAVRVDDATNYGYTTAQPLDIIVQGFDDNIHVARPPKLRALLRIARQDDSTLSTRWAPRDAASSSLTALLSPSFGVPLWTGTSHAFPARAFGAIRPARAVKRDVDLTAWQLARLAIAGAFCTSATRAALNPLELAKTRKQAGREKKKKEEEGEARWVGVDANAASGAALGACSFAVYELLRRQIPRLAQSLTGDPSLAAAFELPISLAASGGAVLVAAATVAPFEAAKVRIMLGNVSSLAAALVDIYDAAPAPRLLGLWSSFWPLVARELPFTTAKLLTYSSAQAALFALLPAARERPVAALAVSCVSGALAGAAGAVLSAPADAVVTELATGNHGTDIKLALAAILGRNVDVDEAALSKHHHHRYHFENSTSVSLDDARSADLPSSFDDDPRQQQPCQNNDDVRAALPRLFAGVQERMLLFSIVITVQLVLFDFCRSLLKVSPDDLALSLDIFADRLSFYDYI